MPEAIDPARVEPPGEAALGQVVRLGHEDVVAFARRGLVERVLELCVLVAPLLRAPTLEASGRVGLLVRAYRLELLLCQVHEEVEVAERDARRQLERQRVEP